jgi:hypothetical protein
MSVIQRYSTLSAAGASVLGRRLWCIDMQIGWLHVELTGGPIEWPTS